MKNKLPTILLTISILINSCYLELRENMTYIVVDKGKIIESSNWHYEVGGDYFITYLDNDRHQLGSGNYSYERYKLKYSERNN